MEKIRSLLSIRKMDRVQNAWIKESKGVDERIEDLHWFSHVERMENDRIAKRLCNGN